ncbi:MAG: hypothetical protein JNK53_08100, partial [Phycisphaerae bacterium]|nr:hypothetical protein [Phycisphaerae bacterium]
MLLALAVGGRAHAQSWKDFSNTATCALPVRYALSELNDALRWNDIAVAPGALARAHASYADAIDALLPACVPIAATVVQGSNMSAGTRASDAELGKLRALQRKHAAAADAAEGKLFDDLAVAAAALPDEARARLDALRERRSLARLIEGVQRRCAVRGHWDNPPDAGPQLNVSGDWKLLPPRVRIAMSAAYDSMAAERRRAWTSAEAAVDASIAASAAAQRDTAQPEGGYMDPPIEPIPIATAARLMRVELDTLRAVGKAVPEVAVRLKLAEEGLAGARWAPPSLLGQLPTRVEGQHLTVYYFATIMLQNPQWDDATRASIRPVLAKWLQQDLALVSQWLDASIDASGRAVPEADRNEQLDEEMIAARAAIARDNLAQLTAMLKVDWLVPDGAIPYDPHTALPSTEGDFRDFG